jgi:hypothetical protein
VDELDARQDSVMKVINATLIICLSVVFIHGCAQSSQVDKAPPEIKPEGARLSNTDAIRIALETAEREGYDLKNYKVGESHCAFYPEKKEWFISINGRVAMPGNHFSVIVNDRTGEAELRGGM